jgi:hypothetical protein
MRRVALVLGTSLGLLAISAPAQAFAHNRVTNPYLHAVLDVLTLAVVTAPIWTAFTWHRGSHTRFMLALIALIQIPVAVIAFVPIPNPIVHAIALFSGLGITVSSIIYVRRSARAEPVAAKSVAR